MPSYEKTVSQNAAPAQEVLAQNNHCPKHKKLRWLDKSTSVFQRV